MNTAKAGTVNVFTKGSDIQIGSLSLEDYHKVLSDIRRDADLHGAQLFNATMVVFNAYFFYIKMFLFMLGITATCAVIFSADGMDSFAKDLHNAVTNGLPDKDAEKLREIYGHLIETSWVILVDAAGFSVFTGAVSLIYTYVKLFKDRFGLESKLARVFDAINRVMIFIDRLIPAKKPVPIDQSGRKYVPQRNLFGYRNIFDENIGLMVKTILQEQTDADIYVKPIESV